MKQKRMLMAVLILVSLTVLGCGLGISAQKAATQTAAAWTATPSPTSTATPTATPTVTPTASPTPTSTSTTTQTATASPTPLPTGTPLPTPTVTSPPVPAGFRGFMATGFFIALPEQWETVDVDQQGIESIMSILENLNTDWADNFVNMFSSEALLEALKFWAMDPKPAGMGYASANVTYQAMPITVSRDDLCAQLPATYQQLGIEILDSNCDVEINGLETAQFTARLSAGVLAVKQEQFIFMNGRDMWSLTLSVDETQWETFQPIFELIAGSFRVIE